MNISLTKKIEEANFITHNGKFHCDEVFSTIILSEVYDEIILCRTSELTNISPNQFVFDVGEGKFDHHQANAETRENGIKYASAGLIWREYRRESS